MIFWKLFYTFCKIGIFNFGGGYAMISLIHSEVVEKNAWITAQEFTDIVAISQSTPGPLGINVATYCGYTAVVNAGYEAWLGVFGAFLASFSVVLLPFVLMLLVCKFLRKYKDSRVVASIFKVLRPAVVGLVAAAALVLITPETFGVSPMDIIVSGVIFAAVFVGSARFKVSPILLLLASGGVGLIIFHIMVGNF